MLWKPNVFLKLSKYICRSAPLSWLTNLPDLLMPALHVYQPGDWSLRPVCGTFCSLSSHLLFCFQPPALKATRFGLVTLDTMWPFTLRNDKRQRTPCAWSTPAPLINIHHATAQQWEWPAFDMGKECVGCLGSINKKWMNIERILCAYKTN